MIFAFEKTAAMTAHLYLESSKQWVVLSAADDDDVLCFLQIA